MAFFQDLTPAKIGFGVTLFVGGGFTAYALMRHRYAVNENASSLQEIARIARQIEELRRDIKNLNQSLHSELSDLKKDIQNSLNSDRRSKTLSVWSFRTACSDEEVEGSGQVPPIEGGDCTPGNNHTISSEEKKRAFFAEVDRLYAGNDDEKEAAMRTLQDNEIQFKDDWEFLWRLGRSHISLHEARTLIDEKKTHAVASLQYTEQALNIYEASSDVHKWYAIALGTMTDYIPTKEKITNGFKLKEHIQRALELNPSEPTLHFMLGRWCWGVYMLSWIERKLAATLFATPPVSTVEDALQCFLKAEEINPGFYKCNQLYIAKCYYEKGQYEDARRWLTSARELPTVNMDDKKSHEEVVQLLEKI